MPAQLVLHAKDDLSKESIQELIWQRVLPLVSIYRLANNSYPSIHRQSGYSMIPYQKGFLYFFKDQFIAREKLFTVLELFLRSFYYLLWEDQIFITAKA